MPYPQELSISELMDRIKYYADGRFDLKLRPGVSVDDIAEAEEKLGYSLPDDLKEFYLLHDGQDWNGMGIVFGFAVLPLPVAVGLVVMWRDIVAKIPDQHYDGNDEGLRPLQHHDRWIPIVNIENYVEIIVDTDPAEGGSYGQVAKNNNWKDEWSDWKLLAGSFTDLMQKFVRAIDAGHLRSDSFYPDHTLAPGNDPWRYIAGERVPLGPRTSWASSFDPAWTAYFESQPDAFLDSWGDYSQVSAPEGATTLAPLAEISKVSDADLKSYDLESLRDLPDWPNLYSLTLRRLGSLDGLERFPRLGKLAVLESHGLDVGPLAAQDRMFSLSLGGRATGWSGLADTEVSRISVVVRSVEELDEILPFVGRADLTISAPGVDVSLAKHWRYAGRIFNLTLDNTTVGDLDFLETMNHRLQLRISDSESVGLRGIAQHRIQSLWLRNIGHIADVSELADVTPPTGLSVPFDIYLQVRDVASPQIWSGFTDRDHTEQMHEIAAANSAARAKGPHWG